GRNVKSESFHIFYFYLFIYLFIYLMFSSGVDRHRS
ncbi:hypothetical protein X975_00884, partial [Stegodyphus mimosarum]